MYLFGGVNLKNIFKVLRINRLVLQSRFINSDSKDISDFQLERLRERSLLKIDGKDAFGFLQALSTNDVNALLKDKLSVYTMFLNARGRVLHDGIIYRNNRDDSFFLETDITSVQPLIIHLVMYQGNKKILITNEENNYSVWSVHSPIKDEKNPTTNGIIDQGIHDVKKFAFLEEIDFGDDVIISYDPRSTYLGIRLILRKEIDLKNVLKEGGFKVKAAENGELKLLRYKLGIGEGISELLYGKYLPKEVNCDYLNALSNKKDGYLGMNALKDNQFIENRIMPIKILEKKCKNISVNSPLADFERRKKLPLGYVRGIKGQSGIAYIQVPKNLEKEVRIGTVLVRCVKPFWWPEFKQPLGLKQNICSA